MTEPVSAIVACTVCGATAWCDNLAMTKTGEPVARGSVVPLDRVSFGPGPCPFCNGTGLIRIRALAEDVPTIDRVPKEDE